jgi:hypothetical protein
MNIGEPKTVREIEPVTLPIPEVMPDPEPATPEVPAPAEQPREPVKTPGGSVRSWERRSTQDD